MAMTRRSWKIAIAVAAVAVIVGALSVQYDGHVRPIDARLDVTIGGSESWYAPPTLASRDADPTGVYVVVPALPKGDVFDAVRIDSHSGAQTRSNVTLGPGSSFHHFKPAGAQVRVRGIRFERPAFHLLRFPDGGGPGIHLLDSASGRMDVMSGDRVLFTRNVFNSSNAAEVLSRISSDAEGRWEAALIRTDEGWRLILFERRGASQHAANFVEES